MLKMDSHIHSEYSPDSFAKIDNIFRKAIQENIKIIALSDHNTVDDSKVTCEKSKNLDILVVPSIEISSSEGHILGFGCEEHLLARYFSKKMCVASSVDDAEADLP